MDGPGKDGGGPVGVAMIGLSVVLSPNVPLPSLTTRGVVNCDLAVLDLALIDHRGLVNCGTVQLDLTTIGHRIVVTPPHCGGRMVFFRLGQGVCNIF